MVFDANLVLVDGNNDWTYDRINTRTKGQPTSASSRDEGFIVIDLKALSGTGAKGMAAIFIAEEAANASGDALTLIIEASDQEDFTSELESLCGFAVDGANGSGVIDGDETPVTIVRRFSTMRRYIRANASVTSSDDFKACHVLLAPWPFHTI